MCQKATPLPPLRAEDLKKKKKKANKRFDGYGPVYRPKARMVWGLKAVYMYKYEAEFPILLVFFILF